MAKYSSRRPFKKRDARDLLGRRVTGVVRADRTAIAVELDGDILLAPAKLVSSDGSSTEPILVDDGARAVLINDRNPDEAEVFTLDVDGSYRDRTPGTEEDDEPSRTRMRVKVRPWASTTPGVTSWDVIEMPSVEDDDLDLGTQGARVVQGFVGLADDRRNSTSEFDGVMLTCGLEDLKSEAIARQRAELLAKNINEMLDRAFALFAGETALPESTS